MKTEKISYYRTLSAFVTGQYQEERIDVWYPIKEVAQLSVESSAAPPHQKTWTALTVQKERGLTLLFSGHGIKLSKC